MQTNPLIDERTRRRATPLSDVFAGRHILLVDDSLDTLESFSMLLVLQGAQVVAVASAADALYEVTKQDFDLVISDLVMPDMDGFSLVRALRDGDRNAHVPVIAVSGLGDPDTIEKLRASGFTAHLPKPLLIDALSETVSGLEHAQQVA